MTCTIVTITEPDFGCEGIPEGSEKMDIVTLEYSNGTRIAIHYSDKELYRLNLNEGDSVFYDAESSRLSSC